MFKKYQNFLSTAAYTIYGVLFGFILLAVIFNNTSFDYRISLQLALVAAVLVCFATAVLIYSRFALFIQKHRYKLLALFCLVVFAIQLAVSSQMVPSVLYDHGKVFNGAVMWATQGNVADFRVYDGYLHHYPHQAGIFMLQQLFFKVAAAVGYTNYFMVACIAGHIMFMIMLVASFCYLDENISGHRAMFFLLIIATFLPLYFQSSISYTDTYSVWGAPCMLLFFSRAFKGDKSSSRIFYSLLAGGLLAVVIQIKTTAAIVVVALFIQVLVQGIRKNHIAVAAVLIAAFLATNTAFDSWTYSTVLDASRADEGLPLTHWVMMGLQGDGSYSSYDEWEITGSVPPAQRVEKNIEVIKERLGEMGVKGYLGLLYRKTCRTFGSGTAELYATYLYDADSQPINLVYNIVLQNGRYFSILNNFSQAVYLTALALGVAGAVAVIRKKGEDLFKFAPHIALIGFWIFMMLWESNHRQLINQWSLLFITAAIGLYHLARPVINKKT